jgi:acyl carrier protein
MNDVADTIRQFILSNHLPGESARNLKNDTPLQTSGILDSLAVLGLVAYVEEQFGVQFDVYDTSAERFDRIQDIAASVDRKRAQQSTGARIS